MSKIKEIQLRLQKNPIEYTSLRFLVAKQLFALSFTLYFLSYLFTVGGFYFWPFTLDTLAVIRYHLYSLLVVATVFFGYSLIEYLVSLYMPEKKILTLVALIIGILFWGAVLAIHLGLLSF